MEAVRLSKNFTLKELCATNFPKYQSAPTKQQVANLAYLCATILQPLRNFLGEPVIITSGFRSQTLNSFVGGVSNSRHLQGFAADIRVKNEAHARKMFDFIRRLDACDSVLIERSGATRWLHVQTSYNPRHIANFNYIVS